MDLKEIEKELKKPFKPDEIEYRITATKDNKGLAVAYIQNRAIQNRLDEVMGFNNWKNEILVIDKGKICGLSLRIDGEWITKYDGASDTNIASIKGGISDSMKRAAVQWGIGRYLYNLPTQWVKIDNKGKILERPKLPNWALPDDMKQKDFNFAEINEGVKPEILNKLPGYIENCINAFEKIGVSKTDLETYLCLEADMFTKKDIDTLKTVYYQIYKGSKKREDFFEIPDTKKKNQQTLKLEKLLEGEN